LVSDESGTDIALPLIVEECDAQRGDALDPLAPPAHATLALEPPIGHQIDALLDGAAADTLPGRRVA
jgi:hypothetical protein